jgi:CBS domain containing-hemolysin-like protein
MENIPYQILLIIIFSCLIFSAFASASETAISRLNIIRIKNKTKYYKTAKKANRVLYINEHYNKFINTILITNNLVNIFATSLVTYILFDLAHVDLIYVTLITSAVLIAFGEIVPKNIARLHPEGFALTLAGIIIFIMHIMTPLTFFISLLAKFFSKIFKTPVQVTATEKELIEIVDTIEKEGVLEQDESDLIKNAIEFDDKSLSLVIKDKDECVFFYDNTPNTEIIETVLNKGYSRYPLVSRKTNKVIGVLNIKTIFKQLSLNSSSPLTNLISDAVYISYRRTLPYVLAKMQRSRVHMAIIVNNLHDLNFLGIVTLEDILEELVGEIYDESDILPKGIIQYGTHVYEADGNISVSDLFEYLDETNNPNTTRTIDSWVQYLFKKENKHLETNAIIDYDNLTIKVLEIKRTKKIKEILKVEIDETNRFIPD